MKDKNGREIKAGDVIRYVHRDAVTGIGIAGGTGVLQDDGETLKIPSRGSYREHRLERISRDYDYEVLSK